MKKWMWLGLLLPLLSFSCVGETDYRSETGTVSIPWGPKEGKRNPPEDFEMHF